MTPTVQGMLTAILERLDMASKAVEAMKFGMRECPPEFSGSVAHKAIWLAGFMRGYRHSEDQHREALDTGTDLS